METGRASGWLSRLPVTLERIAPDLKELLITPDKLCDNEKVEQLAKSLWEMYSTPLSRMSLRRDGFDYRPPSFFCWEARLAETLTFALSVPEAWLGYTQDKISACWPKSAAVGTCFSPCLIPEYTSGAYLTLREHYLFSLRLHNTLLAPVDGFCQVISDLREGESAIVQLIGEPISDGWQVEAAEAYEQHLSGKVVRPPRVDPVALAQNASWFGATLAQGVLDTGLGILLNAPEVEMQRRSKARLLKRNPTNHTMTKPQHSGFRCALRIAVQSPDRARREMLVKSLYVAYRPLAGDNEFRRIDVPRIKPFLQAIHERRPPTSDPLILSTPELSRLIQLPTGNLQREHRRVESLAFRETRVPECLTQDGILLGTVTDRGATYKVSWPVTNHDELCLPRFVAGMQGSGKTTYEVVFALEAARHGYSVFALDAADGKLCSGIRDGIDDQSKLNIIDLGNLMYPIGLDWRESATSEWAAEMMASECAVFFNQLVQVDMGPRTRRWFKAAAKVVFARPGATILDVVLMLVSPAFRAEMIGTIRDPLLTETWLMYEGMSENQRMEVYNPIVNRLDHLLENTHLKMCLCQPQKPEIDFRKWADEGKVTLIRCPKSVLGEAGTNALVGYIIRKLWLAILSRYDTPEGMRKPCFLVMDEPHQYMSGSSALWERMVVESRKWRLGLFWGFHSSGQFPRSLKTIIQAAGPHYLWLRTSKEMYQEFEEELQPFSVEEAMQTPAWWGIARIHANNETLPPFLVDLPKPPRVTDRSSMEEEHSQRFGRPVAEVKRDVFDREKIVYRVTTRGRG